MESSPVPPWLQRIHDRLGGRFLGRRRGYALGALIIIAVLLLTQGAIKVPFTVGWSAADTLVRKEAELERLRRETAECAATARFFRTPEGKRFARKLMYNRLEEGERRVVPELPEAAPGVSQRVGEWFHAQKDSFTSAARHHLAVLKRWVADPPENAPEALLATDAPDEPHAAE